MEEKKMNYPKLSLLTVSFLAILLLAVTACEAVPTAENTPPPTPTTEPVAQNESSESGGFRTFVIDSEASTASYIVDEEFFGGALSKYGIPSGRQDTTGSTNAIEGTFEINPDDLTNPLGTASFTVNLSQLSSDQGLRDRWLRNNGPNFNDFPTAEFVATSIENAPSAYQDGDEVQFQLVGEITIREITQPATFDVTASLQDGVIAGSAIAPMKMTDFDIEPPDFANTLTVKDDFEIMVDFVANQQ